MSDLMLTEILAELKRANELLSEQARNTQLMARWEADGVLRQLLKEPRYGFARRLEHYAHKIFSENGEDGMIQEIFRRIGTTNKKFVEFGVSGGIECNTHLLLHFGWSGLWIEAQESWAQFIDRVFAGAIADGRLTLRNDRVTKDNINDILPSAGLHGEIDLLSVDIDGDDYFVCDALTAVSPRAIVVEYNASFPPPMKYLNQMSRPDGLCFGASLAAMADMLFHKGYPSLEPMSAASTLSLSDETWSKTGLCRLTKLQRFTTHRGTVSAWAHRGATIHRSAGTPATTSRAMAAAANPADAATVPVKPPSSPGHGSK